MKNESTDTAMAMWREVVLAQLGKREFVKQAVDDANIVVSEYERLRKELEAEQ